MKKDSFYNFQLAFFKMNSTVILFSNHFTNRENIKSERKKKTT